MNRRLWSLFITKSKHHLQCKAFRNLWRKYFCSSHSGILWMAKWENLLAFFFFKRISFRLFVDIAFTLFYKVHFKHFFFFAIYIKMMREVSLETATVAGSLSSLPPWKKTRLTESSEPNSQAAGQVDRIEELDRQAIMRDTPPSSWGSCGQDPGLHYPEFHPQKAPEALHCFWDRHKLHFKHPCAPFPWDGHDGRQWWQGVSKPWAQTQYLREVARIGCATPQLGKVVQVWEAQREDLRFHQWRMETLPRWGSPGRGAPSRSFPIPSSLPRPVQPTTSRSLPTPLPPGCSAGSLGCLLVRAALPPQPSRWASKHHWIQGWSLWLYTWALQAVGRRTWMEPKPSPKIRWWLIICCWMMSEGSATAKVGGEKICQPSSQAANI